MKIFLFFLSHRFSIRAIYWNTIWQGSEIKKHFSIRLCLDSRQIILMQKLQYFIIIRALSRHIATCFNSRFTLDFYWIIQKWCWLSLLLWKWRLVRAVCDTLLERRWMDDADATNILFRTYVCIVRWGVFMKANIS